jgi:hypothetical protein
MSVRSTALLAVLAVALTLGGSAGAGTASQPPKKIDLTNPAAVDSYLTSIGVNPATVVRQVGLLNYAGPNCPGVGWNCTTSTQVVQVSTTGGQNKFDCSPGTGTSTGGETTMASANLCVSVQGGDDNKAQCKLKDTAEPTESQRCVIEQDGQRNLAIVDQSIQQRTGPTQNATQTADVTQYATDRNDSQIHQDVKQDTKVSGPQNQNVHQVATVYQQATGSENFSHVHQNQDLSESGAAALQNQNVAPLPQGVQDCDFEFKPGSNPNACASVTQVAGEFVAGQVTGSGGKNESHLHQNINESATTTTSSATQTQEKADTGIEAHIDQSNPPGVGTNHKVTHQDGRQRASGGSTQVQTIDPHCCGVGTTIGGSQNIDDFNQTAIQSASLGAAAEQRLGILGDTNHVQTSPGDAPVVGAPSAPGGVSDVCRISHDARNDEASTHFSISFDPCTGPHSVATECQSTAAVGEGAGFCTPPPTTGGDVLPLSSSPTLGNPIAPPDFGEPSDFPGPIFPGI